MALMATACGAGAGLVRHDVLGERINLERTIARESFPPSLVCRQGMQVVVHS